MRSRSPNGVLTASKAIDPTTVIGMRCGGYGRWAGWAGGAPGTKGRPRGLAGKSVSSCPKAHARNDDQDFAELGLSESTLQALRDVGYESPSPIQEQAIPSLLEGRDVIGQAQTGTGKTAAFGLPIVEYIDPERARCRRSC